MDVGLARTRLATAAKATNTPSVTKLQALPSQPDSIVPPTFYVEGVVVDYYPPEGQPLIMFSFTCKLLLGSLDDKAAQQRIDAFLSGGDKNLRGALEADETLGGIAAGMRVNRTSDYALHEVGGQSYWGTDVEVDVWSTDD